MNKMIPVLALGAIIASLACLHLVKELRAERTRNASLTRQIDDLRTKSGEGYVASAPEGTTGRHEADSNAAAPNTVPTAKVSASEVPVPGEQRQERKGSLQTREHLRDPHYRKLVREEFKHAFDVRYPGVQKELELNDEEVAALIELLADQHLRMMDESGDAVQVDGADQAAIERLRAGQDQRLEQRRREIEDLFGAAKYDKWLEYHRTIPLRHRATNLQAELALVGVPISPDQSKALLATLLQEQQRLGSADRGPSVADGFAVIDSEASLAAKVEHDRQLLSTLQSSLTGEQVSALERILEREQEAQRAQFEAQRGSESGAQGYAQPLSLMSEPPAER